MTKQAMTFKEFVMSQPTDRKIDHGDWGSCAVGDYCVEALIKRRDYVNSRHMNVYALIDDRALYECLNTGGRLLVKDWDNLYRVALDGRGNRIITSYGDIQEYYQGDLKITIE